jgi:hypothetical protein
MRIGIALTTASLAFIASTGIGLAQSGTPANACDLNKDGMVNVFDVQLAADMYIGTVPCTATVAGTGVCNQDVVNRVANAAVGRTCVTGLGPHSVSLNWTASTSANIAGYNIYRSGVTSGPYKKMNASLTAGTTYVDYDVDAGFTYYYVATAVDTGNNESAYSSQASATVPTP